MQIFLQSGFLAFVKRYTNLELQATVIFDEIHSYFFNSKEIYRAEYEEYIRTELEKKSHQKEGIFLSRKDGDRLRVGLVQPHERNSLIQEIINKEEIIVSVKLFRQMLIKADIPLYLISHSSDENKIIKSSDLFLTESTFYELLSCNFEKVHGFLVKYSESDLVNCMNIFFKEFNKEDEIYSIFRKENDVNAFFKLYVEKDIINLCNNYKSDNDWKVTPEQDGAVSEYLQRIYMIPPTKVNKFLMPAAVNVRQLLIQSKVIP
jgi:hypothetical protein